VAPSGNQFELRHGSLRAVVVEAGGALRSFTDGELEVIDGYGPDEMCSGGRGQTLAPWPNRVDGGRWSWSGQPLQLALTEPENLNAIHGLVRWRPWQWVTTSSAAVTLRHRLLPEPGWPWPLDVENSYRLDAAGLTVRTSMTNLAGVPVPVAAGAHPYLHAGTSTVDECHLQVPAEQWLPTDARGIPTGNEPVAGAAHDFRSAARIGSSQLDHAFTDLTRTALGRCEVTLDRPDGHRTTLWLDDAYRFVQVFTGDTLPDASRRRQGLAVEPMTAPPNALATGDSLVVLQPGETWAGEWGIRIA
jgi:aldose 1-epimerase